ncbi:MAG: peptidylprolyl isomerase [Thermoguttaceae bacterium]
MHRATKLGVVWWVLAGLMAAAGCGSKGGEQMDAKTAAIHGGLDAASGQSPQSSGPGSPSRAPRPPAKPAVEIQTTLGTIVVELEPARAPETVDNFLSYVQRDHYNGTIFHRVIKGQAIIGGQFSPDLEVRKARAPIRNEADKCGLRNVRGAIAMMRDLAVIDSAACQFFINLADNPDLDHRGSGPEQFGYCPFGMVVEGMDVVDRIANVPVKDQTKGGELFDQLPVQPVVIQQIRRIR